MNQCVSSQQLQGVETSVKYDVCNMIVALVNQGFLTNIPAQDHIIEGYRSPSEAHRFSTAYHILHGFVTIADLQKTPRDSDGNTWYDNTWQYLFPQCSLPTNIALQALLEYRIKENASNLASAIQNGNIIWAGIWFVRDVNYALEGYPKGDPRRLPNVDLPDISKHTLGLAVDIDSFTVSGDELWNHAIDTTAGRFNLVRPFHNFSVPYAHDVTINEPWHFERP